MFPLGVRSDSMRVHSARTMKHSVRKAMLSLVQADSASLDEELGAAAPPSAGGETDAAEPRSVIEREILLQLRLFGRVAMLGSCKSLGAIMAMAYASACFCYFRGYGTGLELSISATGLVFVIALIQLQFAAVGFGAGRVFLVRQLRLGLAEEDVERSQTRGGAADRRDLHDQFNAISPLAAQRKPPHRKASLEEDTGAMEAARKAAREAKAEAEAEGIAPKRTDISYKVRRILSSRRSEFAVAMVVQAVLLSVWLIRNAVIRGGEGEGFAPWEPKASYASLLVGIVAAFPFQAQIGGGLTVIELTAMLATADLERFRDVLLSSLLDEGLPPPAIVEDISLAQAGVRRRLRRMNKVWTMALMSVVAGQMLLIFFYVFLAFRVNSTVGEDGLGIAAQITLLCIAALTGWTVVGVLRLVARPGDRWAEIVRTDLAHFKVISACDRVFGDFSGVRDVMQAQDFGFICAGVLVSSIEVLRVTAGLILALSVAIFEKFG